MAHSTIEEMASHYVKEIRKLQPTGPYYLGGLCAGGLIAFEVARQLEGYGEAIRHLAILEASPPQAKRRTTTRMQRWQRFSGLFRDVSLTTAGEIVRKGVEKLTGYLVYEAEHRYRRARARSLFLLLRHVFPGGKNWPQALAAPTVREVFAFAEGEYMPSKLHRTQAVIYRATEGKGGDLPLVEILVDPFFGWQDLLSCKAETIDVSGGHGTLLREPHVAVVASRLRASFDGDSKPMDAA
jgi:thioesterase domain-containing protein